METSPSYKIDWFNIGKEYTGTDELKQILLAAAAGIDSNSTGPGEWDRWLAIPQDGTPLTMAMMPGLNISSTIREFKIPRVTHVGISARIAPHGLYGIRGHYQNGRQRVELFVLDSGDSITPLFARVYETQPESAMLSTLGEEERAKEEAAIKEFNEAVV